MKVVIIGNGIAGMTAARTIRKLNRSAEIVMISGESELPISRPALMYLYMGHMTHQQIQPYTRRFWQKNRIELLLGWVTRIDTKRQVVIMADGSEVPFDRVIIATGSRSSRVGWPGEDASGVVGLYGLDDLAALERLGAQAREAVVIGGGLIGVELAEMLLSRGIKVSFLVREQGYWRNVLPEEESRLVTEHIRAHVADLRLGTEVNQILANDQGAVTGVETSDGAQIPCQLAGVAVGVQPNVALATASGLDVRRGIVVDGRFQTSAEGVFACGDCAELRDLNGRVEQVWYTGRAQGEHCARTLLGDNTEYRPAIWYNSAKFFDLEYQTYGDVGPEIRPGEVHFVCQDRERMVRLVADARTRNVIGFNAIGVRLRHRVCEAWLAAGVAVDEVKDVFPQACFDPEFSRSFGAFEQMGET